MENVNSDLITVFWIAVAAIGIGLLIAGASQKVVIYYDGSDMFISFLAFFLPFTALLMFNSAPFESSSFNWVFHWIASPITGIIGLLCIGVNYKNAIMHNRSIGLGLFVGTFKVVFVALTFIIVFRLFCAITNNKSSSKDTVIAGILLAFFVAVANAMINGPKTYKAKGWALPAHQTSAI